MYGGSLLNFLKRFFLLTTDMEVHVNPLVYNGGF